MSYGHLSLFTKTLLFRIIYQCQAHFISLLSFSLPEYVDPINARQCPYDPTLTCLGRTNQTVIMHASI